MTSFTLIIPAAGSGSRSGKEMPKQYVELLGRPVLAHTLRAFSGMPGCREIIIAIDNVWREAAERCTEGLSNVRWVSGGAERQHSIARALAASSNDTELVLVHDAARPCVSPHLIERVLEASKRYGAAIPALPINETVKQVGADNVILATVPRAELRAAQTPQGFHRTLLYKAYTEATRRGFTGTDDASLVEALGVAVHVVAGEPENIKITLPEDFERAERTLAAFHRQGR